MARPGASAAPRAELSFAIVVTLAFAVMLGVALGQHEMWRDELQAWMLARDSGSLAELYANTRYEGHTALWFLLLYVLSRVTRAPGAMQVAHGLVAVATVFLVSWRAPFPRRWRALIPFGYFFAYGYAVVSRPYALGVLLLVAWCAVRTTWPRRLGFAAVLLALLANTSVYGALLATAGGAAMIIPPIWAGAWRDPGRRGGLARVAAIVAVGVAVAVWWTVPPRTYLAQVAGDDGGSRDPAMVRAALTPVQSLLPVPSLDTFPARWQSNALLPPNRTTGHLALAAMGVALLVGGVLLVRRCAEAVVLSAGFFGAYLCFTAWVYAGSLYHHGHLLVVLVAALWLARGVPGRERVAVDALLLVQVVAAGLMLAADAIAPFCGARAAATFLRRSGRADGPLIGADGPSASSIAGYLDRPMSYPGRSTAGTFMRWDVERSCPSCDVEAPGIAVAQRIIAQGSGRPVTLILPHPAVQPHAGLSLTLLAAFPDDLVGEPFYLYDVTVTAMAARVGPAGQPSAASTHAPESGGGEHGS